MIALATALAASIAWARDRAESRAAAIAAENEALRDEVWRLRANGTGHSDGARAREDADGGAAPSTRSATRVLVVAGSPSEAPAIAAGLEEFGAQLTRAEGLAAGLQALAEGSRPDLVIVDCALGPQAADALSSALHLPGARNCLLLSLAFERPALGQKSLEDRERWRASPGLALTLLATDPAGEPNPGMQLPSVVDRPSHPADQDRGLPRAS